MPRYSRVVSDLKSTGDPALKEIRVSTSNEPGVIGRETRTKSVAGVAVEARELGTPEGLRGVQLGEMEIVAVREYGVPLAIGHLWSELGLDRLLTAIPRTKSARVGDSDFQEAVFRMLVNRLCDPHSKLGLIDWTDEHGTPHPGWQRDVQWSRLETLDYHHYLM